MIRKDDIIAINVHRERQSVIAGTCQVAAGRREGWKTMVEDDGGDREVKETNADRGGSEERRHIRYELRDVNPEHTPTQQILHPDSRLTRTPVFQPLPLVDRPKAAPVHVCIELLISFCLPFDHNTLYDERGHLLSMNGSDGRHIDDNYCQSKLEPFVPYPTPSARHSFFHFTHNHLNYNYIDERGLAN